MNFKNLPQRTSKKNLKVNFNQIWQSLLKRRPYFYSGEILFFWMKGIQVCSDEQTRFFPKRGTCNSKVVKWIDYFLKSFSPDILGQFNLNLTQSIFELRKLRFLAHLSWKLKWAFLITCRPSSVCPSICPSVCLSVCKLFTFSSSSPEPLGQFQPNLAQSIPGWRGFKFVQMKGPTLLKGEIIMK